MNSCRRAYFGVLLIIVVSLSTRLVVAQSTAVAKERSLVYGLILDNSGSLRSELPKIKEVAKLIIDRNHPNDEAFIVRITDGKRK